MSVAETTLTHARIVLPDAIVEGSLLIRDGKIAAIDGTNAKGEDVGGDYLIPGLVELHTDHLESHYCPRPGVRWNPMASVQAHDAQIAASGITTVFDALRVGTDGDAKVAADDMHILAEAVSDAKAKGRLRADHLIHLRCELSSPDVVEGLEAFIGHDDIRLVSLMDHTPGQRQFVSLEKYVQYYQGKTGMSDAELEALMAQRREYHELYAPENRRQIVARCRAENIAIASHDDATADHIREALDDGVMIAEFPTTIEAADAAHGHGLGILMGAPNLVRGASHSGNVSATELAQRGCLDILSSDYVPFSLLHAAMVLPSRVETYDLPAAVALVTSNPARMVGLDDRGAIDVGKRADLVQVSVDHDVPHVRAVWREGQRVA